MFIGLRGDYQQQNALVTFEKEKKNIAKLCQVQ